MAKHNDVLPGTHIIHRNFLGLIEAISEFDVRMSEHVRKIRDHETHDHYLRWLIHKQVINLLNELRNAITEEIKNNRYYSIQLDCTRNKCRIEQLTFKLELLNYFQ